MIFHAEGRLCIAKDLILHSDTIIIYLANSSWVRLIYVNLMRHRLVLRDQTHAAQLLRMTSPSFVVDQSLKMCNYKWPASFFFIQSVCISMSFKFSVFPSPPELMWDRVLMRWDASLTTAVWLSRPDETASSLALDAFVHIHTTEQQSDRTLQLTLATRSPELTLSWLRTVTIV